MIIKSMIKPVRRHAGLGDPPAAYYNNVPEAANAMIKRAVNFKENEMPEFCNKMNTLILQQKEDVESAVFNHGPFHLAPKFSTYQVSPEKWFRMSVKQKEATLKKFHAAKMSDADTSGSDASIIDQQHTTASEESQLSVDLSQSGITSVTNVTLEAISKKANELLNQEGSVLRAPGSSEAFVVESQTSTKPHYVTIAKNGKITCNDCPGWKASKLCSHAVAVAEKSQTTAKYLKWLKDKGPSSINITALVTSDSHAGTGKKGSQKSTARRKGGRSSKQNPVTTTVDRPNLVPPSTSQTTSQAAMNPPYLSQPLPTFPIPTLPPLSPSTMAAGNVLLAGEQFILSLLQFCSPLVRNCFGCSQSLKPGGNISQPPFNLVVVTQMNRPFPSPQNGEIMFRKGNVYFHVQLSCIRMKQPCFTPDMVQLPPVLTPHLIAVHIRYLQQFGMRL
jgi:hypothetical protein